MKMRKGFRNTMIGLVALVGLFGFSKKAEAAPFSLTYGPTNSATYLYSDGLSKLNPGDEVGAMKTTSTGKKICIGRYVVQESNTYGAMAVYGDDPTTTIEDGAVSGDNIELMIWDSQKKLIRRTTSSPNPVIYGSAWQEADIAPRPNTPQDLMGISSNWLRTDCDSSNNYCDCYDINGDGKITFKDLAGLAAYWRN